MKKFTKLFLSCAAVAALTAAVATTASAEAVALKGGLTGSYENGAITVTAPSDMDATKEATLLVYDASADVTKLETNTDAIVGIDQTTSGVEFANNGLKGAPTEDGGKKYVVALGYYDNAGTFKIAKGNLFGSNVKIGDVDLNNRISSGDASLILEYTVGSATLEGDAATAADVDGNNRISSGDASCILCYTVGLTDPADIGNIVVE